MQVDAIAATHSTWTPRLMRRLTMFAKCGNTLGSVHLEMLFLGYDLSDEQWWHDKGITFSQEAYDHHLREFHISLNLVVSSY